MNLKSAFEYIDCFMSWLICTLQLATIPLAFSVAIYGLEDLARLGKNDVSCSHQSYLRVF